jgi:SagB-type dehydrogenase family enzyme
MARTKGNILQRKEELSWVLSYHEASKHRLTGYAPSPGFLDWANQPCPFRVYEGAPVWPLSLELPEPELSYDALWRGELPAPSPLDRRSVGLFFFYSFALSAWKKIPGSPPWSLRVNPSSGNLHPTEAYWICGGIRDLLLAPAVYHYRPLDHVLEERLRVPQHLWEELWGRKSLPGCFLILTSIHWRELWKYGERGFRYAHLDTGHAIACACAAAALLGWEVQLCRVRQMEEPGLLLGLGAEPPEEAEVVHAVLEILQERGSRARERVFGLSFRLRAFLDRAPWQGKPNRVSGRHLFWPLAARGQELWRKSGLDWPKPLSKGGCLSQEALPDLLWEKNSVGSPRVAKLLRARRSALAMDPCGALPRASLVPILSRLIPKEGCFPWITVPWAPLVSAILFIHRVEGLVPGLYAWIRSPFHLSRLRRELRQSFRWGTPEGTPSSLPLYLLEPGDFRHFATVASCFQEIAGDGALCVAFLGRFGAAVRRFGLAGYALLHWEAGFLGQWLYLEAEAAGVSATGIGCFFDPVVPKLLGLAEGRWQVIYHFSIGRGVADPRLQTEDAYAHARPEDPKGIRAKGAF